LKPSRAAASSAVLAALLAGALPFAVRTIAWPEIVTPAWFVTRGLRLYDQIFFPHTPALILLTALAGASFGFRAAVLRALPAVALALVAALVVVGTRPHRASRAGILAGFFAGLPLLLLLCTYAEGPALWPEPFISPFLVGGALLLERHERTGAPRDVALAGLVFGAAILVKQTSAWAAIGAFAWLLSRRARGRDLALFVGAVASPYAAFALAWAACFRTLAHVRWTLVLPLFSGHSREIAAPAEAADLHEAIVLFLPFPAFALLRPAGRTARLRSPAAFVALSCLGMAWPRWGLLHLAGMTGLAALAGARAILLARATLRRTLGRAAPWARQLAAALGVATFLIFFGVVLFGAGPLLVDALGGPLHFWDDPITRLEAASVRARVPAGGELFVHGGRQTLYPITGTLAPGRIYVNPSFWYYLNKDQVDERLVAALRARPGLPILLRAPPPQEEHVRATRVFSFLETDTVPDGPGPSGTTWRRVAERR
jgi:hypothetical protein